MAAATGSHFDVRSIAGRGRGLVALHDLPSGKQLANFGAFGHTIPYHTFPQEGEELTQCCSTCLCWSSDGLPERCGGCSAVYCSTACQATAHRHGHQVCCAALKEVQDMRPGKYSAKERSRACFLLRAFAQRAAEDSSGASEGEPSFEDAIGQCLPHPSLRCHQSGGVSLTKRLHQRVVKLAMSQAAGLVREAEALRLLQATECNSFFLFDADERPRGSVMYPHAAMINHSCVPNCAMTARAQHLVLETIKPVALGEELTYCYVRTFESGGKETLDPWGFECSCERCDRSASASELAAFDELHRCHCGKIVTAEKADLARSRGRCACHAHNVVTPTAAATATKEAAAAAQRTIEAEEAKEAEEARDVKEARRARKAAAAVKWQARKEVDSSTAAAVAPPAEREAAAAGGTPAEPAAAAAAVGAAAMRAAARAAFTDALSGGWSKDEARAIASVQGRQAYKAAMRDPKR